MSLQNIHSQTVRARDLTFWDNVDNKHQNFFIGFKVAVCDPANWICINIHTHTLWHPKITLYMLFTLIWLDECSNRDHYYSAAVECSGRMQLHQWYFPHPLRGRLVSMCTWRWTGHLFNPFLSYVSMWQLHTYILKKIIVFFFSPSSKIFYFKKWLCVDIMKGRVSVRPIGARH